MTNSKSNSSKDESCPNSRKRKLNEDILELKSDLKDIKATVEENSTKIRKINEFIDKSRLRYVNKDITELFDNVEFLGQNITDLEEKIDELDYQPVNINNTRKKAVVFVKDDQYEEENQVEDDCTIGLRRSARIKKKRYDTNDGYVYNYTKDDLLGKEEQEELDKEIEDDDDYNYNANETDGDELLEVKDIESDRDFKQYIDSDSIQTKDMDAKDMTELYKLVSNKIIDSKLRTYMPTRYCEKQLGKDENMSSRDKKKEMKLLESFIKEVELGKEEPTLLDYFIGLDKNTKKETLEKIKSVNQNTSKDIPKFIKVINSKIPESYKPEIIKKIKDNDELDDHDKQKTATWFNSLLDIPWGTYSKIPISKTDEPDKIKDFLSNARHIMDKTAYGQEKTKDHIIQIISKMISNPEKSNNVFAIYGPPGTGKTTIIKEGMSKALGIPFAFISLGGVQDSAHLDGHDMTYVGSKHGKIVELLKQKKTMSPIFYFDELDKVSKTYKGEEIINLLIHMTDPSQNSLFQDKYFGSLPIDLSKAIFVFSFNDIKDINRVLLDRMELIQVNKFTRQEKKVICTDYMIPELLANYGIDPANINFSNDIIEYIIDYKVNDHNGETKEEGVRNIKRRLENIISKLNVFMLIGGGKSNIHNNLSKLNDLDKITLPINVTTDMVQKLVNKVEIEQSPLHMYT